MYHPVGVRRISSARPLSRRRGRFSRLEDLSWLDTLIIDAVEAHNSGQEDV